ncbi:MAG: hypothetical protein WDN46_21840 [Methylocella sp.]
MMNRLDRLLVGLLWLLGIIFAAGIVHIVSIFALPDFEGKDAFVRLSALAKPAELTLLPRPSPGKAFMPFSDPALAQGVCLFDLSQNPLRLHGEIEGDAMLTLSFRTPTGEIFYSMTDRAAQHGKIDVLILTPEQLESLQAEEDDDDEPPQELRLLAPTRRGFVLINALSAFPSERQDAEQRVKAISCEPEVSQE